MKPNSLLSQNRDGASIITDNCLSVHHQGVFGSFFRLSIRFCKGRAAMVNG